MSSLSNENTACKEGKALKTSQAGQLKNNNQLLAASSLCVPAFYNFWLEIVMGKFGMYGEKSHQ